MPWTGDKVLLASSNKTSQVRSLDINTWRSTCRVKVCNSFTIIKHRSLSRPDRPNVPTALWNTCITMTVLTVSYPIDGILSLYNTLKPFKIKKFITIQIFTEIWKMELVKKYEKKQHFTLGKGHYVEELTMNKSICRKTY